MLHDVVVLGRSGENPRHAVLRAALHAVRDGVSLLEDGLDTGVAGAHGPAGLAGRRVIGMVAALGWVPAVGDSILALAGPAAIRRSLGCDAAPVVDLVAHTGAAWWTLLSGCG